MRMHWQGVYATVPDELGIGGELGWVGHLVDSRAWPAHSEWPEEVSAILKAIRGAKSSKGVDGDHARDIRDKKIARLKEIFRTCYPAWIVGNMARVAVIAGRGPRDWYEIQGVFALVQYAVGIAVTESKDQKSLPIPSAALTQESYDLVAEIFALDWFLIHFGRNKALPPHVASAQTDLRMDGLIDRWQGYGEHLSVILRETCSKIEDLIHSELGWSPSSLPEISDAIRSLLQQRIDGFHPGARRRLHAAGAAGRVQYQEMVEEIINEYDIFSANLFIITPSELATYASLPEVELRAALKDISLVPGCQPDFATPTEDNLARIYSGMDLGDDRFLIWSPAGLVQESHTWFYDLLQRRGLDMLRKKYVEARDATTERIVASSLAELFTERRTIQSVRYASDGRPDVDCLVIVPGDLLVVECKAHLMTAAARRGAPERISKKFDELVFKPAAQATRFVEHLRGGGKVFGRFQRDMPIIVGESSSFPRMVVTYERVDPLAAYAFTSTEWVSEPAWVLPLADLLVIVEILPSPALFWHYAFLRWQQSHQRKLVVQSELDVLGLFLKNKRAFKELAERAASTGGIIVGPAAYAINDYYTAAESRDARKPAMPIPTLILEDLDRALTEGYPGWRQAVEAVLDEPNKTWSRTRAVLRKLRGRGEKVSCDIRTESPTLSIRVEGEDGRWNATVTIVGLDRQ